MSADFHEEEALGKAYDARLMKRLLVYLRPYRLRVAAAVGLSILASLLSLLQPLLVLRAIDHAIPDRDISELWLICLAFFILMSLEYGLQFLYILLVNSTGQYIMYDLRVAVFSHLQNLSLAFFDRNPVGRLMTRVTTDIETLNELFSEGITILFGAIFLLVGILMVLLWLSVPLTCIALSIVPFVIVLSRLFRNWSREGFRAVRTRIARLNAYLQENVAGMQTVQAFVREKQNYKKFQELNRDHYDANIQTILAFSVFFPAVEVLTAVGMGLILWYGGIQVIAGTLTLGVLVAFMEYLYKFFHPIREISAQYGILQSAMASSERIFKLLDEKPGIPEPANPVKLGSFRGTLEFRNVSFEYLPGEPVLHGINFRVEPGEKVAFVGATGSGKSTLMSLILRFYDVTSGQILLDGIDLREISKRDLRSHFGMVLQEVFLFSGTVYENISLGNPAISEQQVEQVTRELGIHPLIERLPEGYRTLLGERGRSLSVGERQLISFSRAMVHNPDILILDEATSSIDTETERMIQKAVIRLAANRTSLIVAHRLSTIHQCNRILVMHKGQVAESGTHQELLAQRGLYYRLYELQYKDQELTV